MTDQLVDVLPVNVPVEDVWVVRFSILDPDDRSDKLVVHLDELPVPSKLKLSQTRNSFTSRSYYRTL